MVCVRSVVYVVLSLNELEVDLSIIQPACLPYYTPSFFCHHHRVFLILFFPFELLYSLVVDEGPGWVERGCFLPCCFNKKKRDGETNGIKKRGGWHSSSPMLEQIRDSVCVWLKESASMRFYSYLSRRALNTQLKVLAHAYFIFDCEWFSSIEAWL